MQTNPLIRNNVTVTGNTAATTSMLFVNGLGYDQHFWQQVTPAFARDYRLILFDHVGATPATLEQYRIQQARYLNISGYATDLLEICAELALPGEMILVGHSLGAMVGMLAAIEQPARFSKLILLGASPCYANDRDYHGGFSKQDIDGVYDAVTQDQIVWSRQLARVAMGNRSKPALVEAFAKSLARIPQEIMLTILCAVLQGDQRQLLARVSVPSLIIHASQDFFVPQSVSHYLHAHLPQSQLSAIDAEGHLPHVTAPQAVVTAMQAYLAQDPATSP
ncbi:alpha/beta fold hydrolase [Paludibacterium sp. B53371]|uniref:alpha/beta fold hydrolase n=1 Tax=Paludibacterium sp. B53371 TaxID=2806263 RepID=UPI001C043F64|nr:alpha/beta hydrolase [Paludibacterium sp. B53371]